MKNRLKQMRVRRSSLVLSYHDVAKEAKMTGQLVHDIECGVIPPVDEDVSRIEEALIVLYTKHITQLDKAFGKQGKLF